MFSFKIYSLYVFYLHVCVCFVHVWCLWSQKRESDPWEQLEFVDSCGQPYAFWELIQGPLEEEQVFLTTEQSLHSLIMFYFPSFILTFQDLVEHCFPVAYFPGLMPDEVILIVLALYSRRAQTMESTVGCLGHSLSLVLERQQWKRQNF